ncbi:hypothetical protein AAEU32_13440 [Pseudoalteromonas sp. SSDWG2]|uniref:hypothetical protein n=1 Tax=Pseudoalteromonas sp. SSDWG2 TaxID=3139391 RepID=UPI003BA8B74E
MTKLTLTLLSCVFASSTVAGTAQYFAKNDTVESQLCAVAANQGLVAAKEQGAKHGIRITRIASSLYCNGQDIRDIAKKVEVVAPAKKAPALNLYAKNNESATKLCIEAAEKGLATMEFKGKRINGLTCNGQPVEKFVEQFGQTAK